MANRRRCLSSRRRRGATRGADARRGHRDSAAIDLNKILKLGSRLVPLRRGHQLQGGTVRALPWPLSPAHAHTHLTLTHGPAAHTLPLTTSLALCRAARRMSSTSSLLEQNVGNVRSVRPSKLLAVTEVAHLPALPLQSGKVRRDERGAVEAMVPRLSACVVRCVARAERGRSARIRECVRHREGFTDRIC
jgi:hypothetical protein